MPRSARVDDMRHSAAYDVSFPLRVGFDEHPLMLDREARRQRRRDSAAMVREASFQSGAAGGVDDSKHRGDDLAA